MLPLPHGVMGDRGPPVVSQRLDSWGLFASHLGLIVSPTGPTPYIDAAWSH